MNALKLEIWYDTYGLEERYMFSRNRQKALRSEGRIPFHRVGHYIRYKHSDIEEWINSHKVV